MADVLVPGYDPALISLLNNSERMRTGCTHVAEVDYKYLNQATGNTGDRVLATLFQTNNNYLLTRCCLVIDEAFSDSGSMIYYIYTPAETLYGAIALGTATGPLPGAKGFWAQASDNDFTTAYGLDGTILYLALTLSAEAPGSYTQGKLRFFYNLVDGRY